ncbi:MAG TPA: tol-pal system protein YbgF [Casimicrobiaceae bacterium]|jgi:tol-pal system protein YbgF|nr:tol-pal system protein YbgF [Casimicrobiaceae bacterium]
MLRGRVGAAFAPAALALVLAAQLAGVPARAGVFDDDEARHRIDVLRGRVDQLESSLNQRLGALESTVKSQGLVDLLHDVEDIKADVAKLRGQFEVLTYELDQAQKRQRDLYLDLDGRLRKLEGTAGAGAPAANAAPSGPDSGATAATGGAAPMAAAAHAPPGPADVATEQRTYDAGLDQFKSGNFAAAVTSFQAFVRAYPRSPLAPSAIYWSGNAQYALRDFRGAIATQRQLLATYPDSQKVPDAMLNIASCQVELGDTAGSRRTLEDLVAKYPVSEAAGKARQRLAGR